MKSQLFKSSAILIALTSAAIVHAEEPPIPVGLDGGTLKQQIDKEAPELPSRALPTPTAPIEENIQSDQGISFKVSAIRLEGVTLVDMDAIQDKLLPSIGNIQIDSINNVGCSSKGKKTEVALSSNCQATED